VTDLYLYDDAIGRAFEPFSLTRPTCELRAGALLLRERWERGFTLKAAGCVSTTHLQDFDEPWGVPVASGVLRKGSILANSRCAVALSPIPAADSWRCGDRIAAVLLPRDVDVEELSNGKLPLEDLTSNTGRMAFVTGRWIDHVWDFVALLSPMLTEDIPAMITGGLKGAAPHGATPGPHPVFVEDGATVEPYVFFDATAGPILLRRGATVQAFTRIVGPCLIGSESIVGGDKIATSSIGENCRVHGELNTAVFLGHANKAHDGFVGHSYLGRWVNLGAGTTTSNLKNTYGTVQLWTPVGERDTGLQFLGTLFGDHAKTGIGMTLTTGTVIGAGANIYGSGMPPKAVPPFAWGDTPPYAAYRAEKFVEVARRMMSRRHVDLSERQAKQLSAAHERRWSVEDPSR
jgi:UDP-N-acetylglucosamine diphosphorylase / glucose-1-phosphate thymidylyltransferase / UDP-N-acetylgalactosamine diphosphorylase / glucosamine-1-phosphate N-acetyltransferase / galactosamine-1-phosphate N-acetyltransferase